MDFETTPGFSGSLGDAYDGSSGSSEPDREAGGVTEELHARIQTLEEQISVLEEGLPRAPGMERAALAKEIAEYRERLLEAEQALRQAGEISL